MRHHAAVAKVLVQFSHPALERSRVHRRLIEAPQDTDGVTFRDLYELYPRFEIDVRAEQQALAEHDVVIFQHPMYWYSAPPLLRQGQDLVLEARHMQQVDDQHLLRGTASADGEPVGTVEVRLSAIRG